jgi:hypothetical protein
METLVSADPVDNEGRLHHRSVDACQTTGVYPAISERMRRSMTRRIEARIESYVGYFAHLLYT